MFVICSGGNGSERGTCTLSSNIWPDLSSEPFGDNSRYWIGPQGPDKEKVDISTIGKCFREYQLPICRKLFGDALSLRFVGRLLNVISGNRARRNSS